MIGISISPLREKQKSTKGTKKCASIEFVYLVFHSRFYTDIKLEDSGPKLTVGKLQMALKIQEPLRVPCQFKLPTLTHHILPPFQNNPQAKKRKYQYVDIVCVFANYHGRYYVADAASGRNLFQEAFRSVQIR